MIVVAPRNPPATLALVGVAAALFVAIRMLDLDSLARALLISEYTQHARPPLPEIRAGEWWRLITPAFLHFGLFHAVFNLLWVWELGRVIESRHGAAALLALSAIVAVVSNLAQFFVAGPLFGGMSGVLYGCFGYVLVQGRFNPAFDARLTPPIIYLLLGWFALGWTRVLEMVGVHIANTAHTAGLLCGIALGLIVLVARRVMRVR
ncbi:MAG: rhomboid family intramembrane serine protease [bacterium]